MEKFKPALPLPRAITAPADGKNPSSETELDLVIDYSRKVPMPPVAQD